MRQQFLHIKANQCAGAAALRCVALRCGWHTTGHKRVKKTQRLNIWLTGLLVNNSFNTSSILNRLLLFLLIAISGLVPLLLQSQTYVQRQKEGFTLMRNGAPYYVKGVGGTVQLDMALAIGANSIRTWGIEQAQEILDEAHKRGLTVMLGLWLQHERHGFDYSDTAKVARQHRHFKEAILRFKDHPALLLWGIGNELDLNYSNTACWDAVQQLARFAHEVDPNHPTSTVTAGLDSMEVQLIKSKAPDVDILGVNTYGDIASVPYNIQRFGWTGPYMITEWGPNGYWEAPQTSWKAAVEQSSTEKKQVYLKRFNQYIAPFQQTCLGSYVFLWGAKQEYTETWFGLFSKEGLPTEPLDALELLFREKMPEHPAPAIGSMSIVGFQNTEARLKAGNLYEARVVAGLGIPIDGLEPDSLRRLEYSWKILAESTDKKSGGDAELAADEVQGAIRNRHSNRAHFRAPAREGAYRLFIQVQGNGKVAYHNIPFLVEPRTAGDGQARWIEVKPQHMKSFYE